MPSQLNVGVVTKYHQQVYPEELLDQDTDISFEDEISSGDRIDLDQKVLIFGGYKIQIRDYYNQPDEKKKRILAYLKNDEDNGSITHLSVDHGEEYIGLKEFHSLDVQAIYAKREEDDLYLNISLISAEFQPDKESILSSDIKGGDQISFFGQTTPEKPMELVLTENGGDLEYQIPIDPEDEHSVRAACSFSYNADEQTLTLEKYEF
jgi:hypothetical protein